MNQKLAQRVETIKLGMQKLAQFAAQPKVAAAPAPGPSLEEIAKVKELSIQIGSKLAAMNLIQTDMIEKNAAAFSQDHVKTLSNTVKILDHLLAEKSAAKTASAGSMGTVVDPTAAPVKKPEAHRPPRC